MDSAAPHVRRIAILVTSLDAAAARQLLVHMPPELAKQVRKAVANLRSIDPDEQERVLADFRKQASVNSQPPKTPLPATTSEPSESVTYVRELSSSAVTRTNFPQGNLRENGNRYADPRESGNLFPLNINTLSGSQSRMGAQSEPRVNPPVTNHAAARMPNFPHSDEAMQGQPDPRSRNSSAMAEMDYEHSRSWKSLDSDALVHLLQGERPAVIAVVLSQLNPETAVSLLKSLPEQEHSKILARLARLQEIDEEAMAAIDDHLARRLHDYRHEMTSASESLARIEALLSVAPPQWREQWLKDISGQDTLLAHRLGIPSLQSDSQRWQTSAPRPEIKMSRAVQANQKPRAHAEIDALANHVVTTADLSSQSDTDGNGPQILPFSRKENTAPTDSSLVKIEFEQLLELPPHQLAEVLSTADPEVVLLALAGASPAFMKRFGELLDRQDARDLQKRLRNIGPLSLRDIDEAQLEISELAAQISSLSRNHSDSQRPAKKVAA